jgi:hypothetical protein
MKIIVAGSGPSLAQHADQLSRCTVMAVNGALTALPKARYWFTLDLSPSNRRLIPAEQNGTMFFVAGDGIDKTLPGHVTQLQRVRTPGNAQKVIKTFEQWCDRYGAVLGCQRIAGLINTGNSATGAIQLAIQLGYTDILLVGVDGQGDYHDNTGKPRDLVYLPDLMQALADDLPEVVTVRNCSNRSRIKCFEYITLEQWLCQ